MLSEAQAQIAVPLLNSYAHQYLGLRLDEIMVAAGRRKGVWIMMVATLAGVEEAKDFDAAKALIDGFTPRPGASR